MQSKTLLDKLLLFRNKEIDREEVLKCLNSDYFKVNLIGRAYFDIQFSSYYKFLEFLSDNLPEKYETFMEDLTNMYSRNSRTYYIYGISSDRFYEHAYDLFVYNDFFCDRKYHDENMAKKIAKIGYLYAISGCAKITKKFIEDYSVHDLVELNSEAHEEIFLDECKQLPVNILTSFMRNLKFATQVNKEEARFRISINNMIYYLSMTNQAYLDFEEYVIFEFSEYISDPEYFLSEEISEIFYSTDHEADNLTEKIHEYLDEVIEDLLNKKSDIQGYDYVYNYIVNNLKYDITDDTTFRHVPKNKDLKYKITGINNDNKILLEIIEIINDTNILLRTKLSLEDFKNFLYHPELFKGHVNY